MGAERDQGAHLLGHGKVRRAREGRNPGGPVPFGYRLSGQSGILEVDPERAAIVRRIFDDYLREQGAFRIARQLNRESIPSPTGISWRANTLLKILRNPIYCGRLRYWKVTGNPKRQRDRSEPWYFKNPSPIEADAQFTAIIPEAQFRQVQELLSRRAPRRTGARALSSSHLLTGMIKCACGASMIAHVATHGGRSYSYYACRTYKSRGAGACNGGLLPQGVIDQQVEAMVKRLLEGEQASVQLADVRRQHFEQQRAEVAVRRRQVHVALQALDEQARRLGRDYRLGHLSAPLYDETRRAIDHDREEAQEQAIYLDQLAQSLSSTEPTFSDLARRWEELDRPKRKIVLRHLLEEVVAFKPAGTKDVCVQIRWKCAAPGQGK